MTPESNYQNYNQKIKTNKQKSNTYVSDSSTVLSVLNIVTY